MSPGNFTAAWVTSLLKGAGAFPVTWQRLTPATYDANTGTSNASAGAVFSCLALKVNDKLIFGPGGEVQTRLRAYIVNDIGSGNFPQPGDLFNIGPDTHTVLTVDTTAPFGINLLHKLYLKS